MSSSFTVTLIPQGFKDFLTKVTSLYVLKDGHQFLPCSTAAA